MTGLSRRLANGTPGNAGTAVSLTPPTSPLCFHFQKWPEGKFHGGGRRSSVGGIDERRYKGEVCGGVLHNRLLKG